MISCDCCGTREAEQYFEYVIEMEDEDGEIIEVTGYHCIECANPKSLYASAVSSY